MQIAHSFVSGQNLFCMSGGVTCGGGDDISEEQQPFITLFLRLEAAGLIDGKVALLE